MNESIDKQLKLIERTYDLLERQIQKLMAMAVEYEREECAKIAERISQRDVTAPDFIARTIRARGE